MYKFSKKYIATLTFSLQAVRSCLRIQTYR